MVNGRVESALEVLGRYRCHDSNTLPIHITHAIDQLLQPTGGEEEKMKKRTHHDDDDQGEGSLVRRSQPPPHCWQCGARPADVSSEVNNDQWSPLLKLLKGQGDETGLAMYEIIICFVRVWKEILDLAASCLTT